MNEIKPIKSNELHKVKAKKAALSPKERKKKKRRRIARRILLIFLILIALVAIYLVAGGYAGKLIKLHSDAVKIVDESSAASFEAASASVVYDSDGNVIAELGGSKDIEFCPSDEIPDYVKQAFVSIEDKRFYDHSGVDLKGIGRALWAMIRNGKISGGGSTLTQQLARNVFLSQEKTWERKIEELFIAQEMEKKYSKDEILTYYINNVYFMNGYYGISAAAKGYFSKTPEELDLAEIAFLCAIPNSPTYYDPLNHFDHTTKRQHTILSEMLEDGVIDQSTYDKAIAEEIVLNPDTSKKEINNYQTTYAQYCAVRALMENEGFEFQYTFSSDDEKSAYNKEYNEAYDNASTEIYGGGFEIYTSLDSDLQDKLQASVDDNLSKYDDLTDDGIYDVQSAAVSIDNSTGMVVAIVGGRSQDTLTGYTLNRAYQSYRQPGSSIKPLAVYTPALENGYNPNTTVTDEKIEDGPKNADGKYHGTMTLRNAVEQSYNTVAWQVFKDITPKKGLSYLHKMNFEKIVKSDETLSAGIGGLTYGCSPVEMAKGYSTLANDGKYRDPSCIVKMLDRNGDTVYKNKNTATRVYTEEATAQMTEILQGVLVRGTGKGLDLGSQPAAAKTGTTNDNKDAWFCGYTPYYTTSVWVGCDTPKQIKGLTGGSYPGKIWQTFMKQAHEGLEVKKFDKSNFKAESDANAAEQSNQAAADAVTSQITSIGEVSLEKAEQIANARAAYNALSEEQKALVSEEVLNVLSSAEVSLSSAQQAAAEAKAAAEAANQTAPQESTTPEAEKTQENTSGANTGSGSGNAGAAGSTGGTGAAPQETTP